MSSPAFPLRSRAAMRAAFLGALVALGASVMFGWILRVPLMFRFHPALLPVVFNTGLGFALLGLAMSLAARTARAAVLLRRSLALLVALGAVLSLLEILSDRSLGIDLAGLHSWHDYANIRPGRMAPNTAFGLLLIAAAILCAERVERKAAALAVVVLTFCVMGVGLTGLVGYSLGPDLLFGWARSARMAVPTAIGMIVAAAALWLDWSDRPWYRSRRYFREDAKIRFLGVAILLVVAVTIGLVGFVLLQSSLQRTLERDLESIVRSRTPWFHGAVERAAGYARAALTLSGIERAGASLLAAPSAVATGHFDELAARLVAAGFRGVSLRNARGETVGRAGVVGPQAEIDAPLDADGASELVWDGQLLLRNHLPVRGPDGRAGDIVLDQAVPALFPALFNATRLGRTGEIAVCRLRADTLLCFPDNKHAHPYSMARDGRFGKPTPAAMAIRGESGLIHTIDQHGHNVVAAYRPLGPGLGFTVQQDTAEVYGVIRAALALGTPLILLIACIGAVLLYGQLNPLSRAMLAAELAAADKELEMRAIMGAAGDGIVTVDQRGVIESLNEAACRIFGYRQDQLVGRAFTVLMPAVLCRRQLGRMARTLRGRAAPMAGAVNLEIEGLCMNGERIPLELSINEVPLTGKRLFVGVMRNISKRKEVEQKLSDLAQYDFLTGLPNRALCMDRLQAALLRADRSSATMAVMFLDLDGFKQINDSHGHQAGDELLIEFALRLVASVRASDTVARLAGDEFTVVLEGLSEPEREAAAVAAKILVCMRKPFEVAGHALAVTVSIGMVLHHPGRGGTDPRALLKRADQQMYAVKRAGKNAFLGD
ncbi:MAG: diguanylate cyclase [Massilia sp.]